MLKSDRSSFFSATSPIRPLSPPLVREMTILKHKKSASHISEKEKELNFQELKRSFPHIFRDVSSNIRVYENLPPEKQKEIKNIFQRLRTGMFPLSEESVKKISSFKTPVSDKELLAHIDNNPKIRQI